MGCNALWENKFAIAMENLIGNDDNRDGAFEFNSTEEDTDFDIGLTDIETKKASGSPQMETGSGKDYQKGNQAATFAAQFLGNADYLTMFMATIMQGVTETSTAGPEYEYDMAIYASNAQACITKSATGFASSGGGPATMSCYKGNSVEESDGEVMNGCIAESLSITSAEGGQLEVAANMISMAYDDNDNLDAGTAVTFTAVTRDPIRHSDLTFQIDGSPVDVQSWTLNITPNQRNNFFNNQTIKEYTMGRFTGTLDLVLPWDIATTWKASAEAGTDFLVKVSNNATAINDDAGDVFFNLNGRLQNAPNTPLDALKGITLNFVLANDGSNPALAFGSNTGAVQLTS